MAEPPAASGSFASSQDDSETLLVLENEIDVADMQASLAEELEDENSFKERTGASDDYIEALRGIQEIMGKHKKRKAERHEKEHCQRPQLADQASSSAGENAFDSFRSGITKNDRVASPPSSRTGQTMPAPYQSPPDHLPSVRPSLPSERGAAPSHQSTGINTPSPQAQSSRKRKKIDAKMQIRKYQLMLNGDQMGAILEHFHSTITDKSLPRSERATMVHVGSRLAKLLIKQKSDHAESSKILKTCLSVIGVIGVEGPNEFTTQWEIHDDLAVCYSSLGNMEMEAKHYRKAIDLLSTVSVQPERYPHMMNNLGNCYKKLERFTEAREMLERAKKIMSTIYEPVGDYIPEDFQKVVAGLADCYNLMDLRIEAIAEYELLLGKMNADTTSLSEGIRLLEAKRSLADVYRRNGEPEKAAALNVDGELALKPKDVVSLLDNAESQAEGGGSTDRSDLNRALVHVRKIRQAEIAQNAGNKAEAIRYYEEALVDVEEAGAIVERALDKSSIVSAVHNNVANMYAETGFHQKALAHNKEAIRLREAKYGVEGTNDDLASSYFNLGNLYTKMNLHADGLTCFQRASKVFERLLSAGNVKAKVHLARSLKTIGQLCLELKTRPNHMEEAKDHFAKALETYKTCQVLSKDVRIDMSVCYENMGDEENAIAILEEE